jgi:hypothetical protein
MSIRLVQQWTARLPYALREQVVGYARSVEQALPEIQDEAKVELASSDRDLVVFLAGLRKLYSLVSSSYWTVENAGEILTRHGAGAARSGNTYYSRDSELFVGLRQALDEMQTLLREHAIEEELLLTSYTDLVKWIADGREEDFSGP